MTITPGTRVKLLSLAAAEALDGLYKTVSDQQQVNNEQQEVNNRNAAALNGRLRMIADNVATIGALAGLYDITAGPEAGQVWERLVDGTLRRRQDREAENAPVINMLRRGLEVTPDELRSGTFNAGTLSRIFSPSGSLTVMPSAQAPAPDNVMTFQLADDKTAVLDMVPKDSKYFGIRDRGSEEANTKGLADFGEFARSCRRDGIPDLSFGSAALELDPGEYRYGDLPIFTGHIAIIGRGGPQRGAVLKYMGTGHSMRFNSDVAGPYTNAPQLMNSLAIRNLTMMSEQGSGIFLGSVIQPSVTFDHVEFKRHKLGYVIECGEAVYYVTIFNCTSVQHHKFLLQKDYCDRLSISHSSFGASEGEHLTLAGPTFEIVGNNFESTGGLTGAIRVLVGVASSGNIVRNRFGSEGNIYLPGEAQKVAPYDVVVDTEVNTPERECYNSLVVENNKHFSRSKEEMVD